MMDFENLLNEFEHACRGGDYEISVCLRKEIIKKVEQLQQENEKLTRIAAEADEGCEYWKDKYKQMKSKSERYEKAIKECVERMNEGGPGTRSFVYEKLTGVMEGTECMGK